MMDASTFTMNDLFLQLGLDANDQAVEEFFRYHHLNRYQRLTEADFWNASQAHFIRENWRRDAEWVQLIDQMDVMLRH